MDGISAEEAKAGQRAEELFRDYCDKAGITYLYVEQSGFTKSSRLIREQAARPDYLVIEPHKMPIFVDVKAHSFRTADGKPNFFLEDKNIEAIFFAVQEFLKLLSLQSHVGIPVWLAWFERIGSDVRPQRMHVLPVSVATDFWAPASSIKSWRFIQIPIPCCSSIDLGRGEPFTYRVESAEIQGYVKRLKDYLMEKEWVKPQH